jgi:hypothetical protein
VVHSSDFYEGLE